VNSAIVLLLPPIIREKNMIMHFRIPHWDRYVGIFILLALLILTATLVFVTRGQKWFEKRYQYTASFAKVQGLKPGTPVTISGMEVGSVKAFRLNPLGRVEVQMEILETYKDYIRVDSAVTIATTLLGGKALEIRMGSPTQPPLGEGAHLKSQESKELTDILKDIDLQMPLKKVDETLENLRSLTSKLNSPEGEVFAILKNVQFLTTQLKEGEGTAGAILRDRKMYLEVTSAVESVKRSAVHVESVTEKAAEIAKELPAMMHQVDGRIREIQGMLDQVKKATAELSPILENLSRASVEAPAIAGNIRDITEDVRAITGDVKKATPEIPELVNQTQEIIEDADKVMTGVQNHWLLRGLVPRAQKDPSIAISQRQSPYEKKGDAPR
jgi:phospholipid/cholesterol/gamma-HCH transport system substrate-binding protein